MIERVLRVFTVVALGAAFLVPVGCATKSFVREQVQGSETRVGQQLSMQGGRVGTLETGLNQERERIGRVGARADQAGETANQALAKAEQ